MFDFKKAKIKDRTNYLGTYLRYRACTFNSPKKCSFFSVVFADDTARKNVHLLLC